MLAGVDVFAGFDAVEVEVWEEVVGGGEGGEDRGKGHEGEVFHDVGWLVARGWGAIEEVGALAFRLGLKTVAMDWVFILFDGVLREDHCIDVGASLYRRKNKWYKDIDWRWEVRQPTTPENASLPDRVGMLSWRWKGHWEESVIAGDFVGFFFGVHLDCNMVFQG